MRKDPGAWAGAKGMKVATAAIGAAGMDFMASGKGDDKGKGGDRSRDRGRDDRDGGSKMPSGMGAVGSLIMPFVVDQFSKRGKK